MSRARAASLRRQVRQARTLRLEDRRQRLQRAPERLRERLVLAAQGEGSFSEVARTAATPPAAGEGWPWRYPPHASASGHLPGRENETRLYVWGYSPPRTPLLRGAGQSTPEARAFAVERGWDDERRGAWAIELLLPVPLSVALAALHPMIRTDSAVIGYGGQSARSAHCGSPLPPLRPLFGSDPREAADQIRRVLLPRPDPAGPVVRVEGIDPESGHAALKRSEALRERVSDVMVQSCSLCVSIANALQRSRSLRSRLAGTGSEWQPSMAQFGLFLDGKPPGPQSLIGPPDLSGDEESWLPATEFAVLSEVVTHAHDLAAAGCLAAGYSVLLTGRHRAGDAAAAGEDWAPELIGIFSLALENYIWRYGAKLE